MTKNSIFLAALFLVLVLGGAIIFSRNYGGDAQELIIYSGRNEDFVRPLLDKFEEETGIRTRLLSGSAANLGHRLVEESHRPQADAFLANDAGIMEFVRREGVLTPITSDRLEDIPAEFRAEDGTWSGLSGRARVLMYNPELIDAEEMPQSIFDLADPQYHDQFAITRSGNASMVSHIAAIRNYAGDEATVELIRDILANNPAITRGHSDIRRMVGAGEVKFGLVNNYYYHLQLHEPRHNQVAAIYPDQEPEQMGVFVNVAGIALVDDGPNPEAAQQLAHFLLAQEQQKMFTEVSKEIPLIYEIEVPDYALPIGEFRQAEIPLNELGEVWDDTLELMEQAGYAE